jgi:hypothetical protein
MVPRSEEEVRVVPLINIPNSSLEFLLPLPVNVVLEVLKCKGVMLQLIRRI